MKRNWKRQKANKELASNILAKRLENVLPEILSFDQSAFLKGRTIFDPIRTIDDVIEHAMNRNISRTLGLFETSCYCRAKLARL